MMTRAAVCTQKLLAKPPWFLVCVSAVGTMAIMNSACKSSHHDWCFDVPHTALKNWAQLSFGIR
jgi:hypothetical protein